MTTRKFAFTLYGISFGSMALVLLCEKVFGTRTPANGWFAVFLFFIVVVLVTGVLLWWISAPDPLPATATLLSKLRAVARVTTSEGFSLAVGTCWVGDGMDAKQFLLLHMKDDAATLENAVVAIDSVPDGKRIYGCLRKSAPAAFKRFLASKIKEAIPRIKWKLV